MSQLDNDYQGKALSNGHAKPAMVNDASNVPSRRRRASQHTSANSKNYSPQQLTQDNNELAQLQQLSLASSNKGSNQQHTPKPAPLFVIEHGNVVPPLKKQLSGSDKALPKATQKAPIQKVLEQTTVSKKASADSQSQLQEKAVNKASDLTNRSHAPKESVNTQVSSNNARSTIYKERNAAQSPALVSMNNEPIPHKRRRRQPTVIDNSGIGAEASSAKEATTIDTSSNEKSSGKYAKKVPKLAVGSTDNVIDKAPKPAKASSTKSTKAKRDASSQSATNQSSNEQQDANKVANSNMNANKGPVPSKRRRRQPSVNDV